MNSEHVLSKPTLSSVSTTTPTQSPELSVNPAIRAKRRKPRELKEHEVSMLAAQLASTTKSAARNALQALGVAPTETQIEEVLKRQENIAARRASRHVQNAETRLGHSLARCLATPPRRQPVLLPNGPVADRVDLMRNQAVTQVAKSLFRYGASGGSSFHVEYASTSDRVKYQVSIGSNWGTYKGAYKGWRANEDHHDLIIPRDWRLRVLKRGLAIVGGMMTLDAHPLESPQDVGVHAAVWASQGRGFNVRTHRGFIALCGDEGYHSETAEGAIAGARRKARAAYGPPTSRPTPYSISINEFVDKYRKNECNVTLNDARDSGSCEFGIRSWCDAVGLDYAKAAAPLHLVLDAFRERPQIEVRRAVVHAVRRHRARQLETTSGGIISASIDAV